MRTDLIVDFVDLTNLSLVSSKLTPKTKMIFIESPTNPMMKIINISEISLLSKKHNIIIVVDNTFASPYLQSPLKLGADICVESCTKFIAGHHDVIMGSAATNSKEIYDKLFHLRTYYGYIPSPFDCYLCLRGIKTLKIRMEEHSKNGLLIAKFLKNHPKIEKVFYPGLEDHPDHELAKKQMRAFGGMLSFYLKGDKNDVRNVCQKVKLFLCAASLGGVESLITVPTSMTHTGLTLEEKSGLGIKENLIRLSVGIEDIDDLIEDLRNALE